MYLKGFYTVSQVILTSVVVRTQFSINIISSYSYTKKKNLDFLWNKDKNKKTTTKNNNNNKINCNIINTLQHTIIDLEWCQDLSPNYPNVFTIKILKET